MLSAPYLKALAPSPHLRGRSQLTDGQKTKLPSPWIHREGEVPNSQGEGTATWWQVALPPWQVAPFYENV